VTLIVGNEFLLIIHACKYMYICCRTVSLVWS